jgi:hypothetical protein
MRGWGTAKRRRSFSRILTLRHEPEGHRAATNRHETVGQCACTVEAAELARLSAPPEPTLAGIGSSTPARSVIAGRSAGLNLHYPVFIPGRFTPVYLVVFRPWQKYSRYLSRRSYAIFAEAWKKREICGE